MEIVKEEEKSRSCVMERLRRSLISLPITIPITILPKVTGWGQAMPNLPRCIGGGALVPGKRYLAVARGCLQKPRSTYIYLPALEPTLELGTSPR